MCPPWQRFLMVGGLVFASSAVPTQARADEIPKEYRETIKKGLDYLQKAQAKDGRWEGSNGGYTISMTALAGMAFLCEGSTLREGKYRDNLRRAVKYLMDRTQTNGPIG